MKIQFPPKRKSPGSILRGIGHALVSPLTATRTFAVADYRVTVPARSIFARQLAKYHGYEPLNSNWLSSRFSASPAGLFVDVGANFGWYSLLSARLAPRATIVALEPSHANFSLLRQNIAQNGFSNIVAINKGAGAESLVASLYAHESDNPGAHSIRESTEATAKETITIEPLDKILSPYTGEIQFLKIDVEGYEIAALQGAAATLRRTKCILLEYSPSFLREFGHEPAQLLELLQSAGFTPNLVRESGLEPVTLQRLRDCDPTLAHEKRWQVDLVFTRS